MAIKAFFITALSTKIYQSRAVSYALLDCFSFGDGDAHHGLSRRHRAIEPFPYTTVAGGSQGIRGTDRR